MAHPTRFEPVTSGFAGQQSIYAARRGMALSTNRKNRVLRTLATTPRHEPVATPTPWYDYRLPALRWRRTIRLQRVALDSPSTAPRGVTAGSAMLDIDRSVLWGATGPRQGNWLPPILK
jgi:hypothetical protein